MQEGTRNMFHGYGMNTESKLPTHLSFAGKILIVLLESAIRSKPKCNKKINCTKSNHLCRILTISRVSLSKAPVEQVCLIYTWKYSVDPDVYSKTIKTPDGIYFISLY